MEIISVNEKQKWNHIVKSFPKWDIYYLNEYAYSLQLHSDGIPCLIYYEKDGNRLCYVMMQEDLADFQPLSNCLAKGEYFDWTAPYGYGGPLTEGSITVEWISEFIKELTDWCMEHRIISQFFSFSSFITKSYYIGRSL